MSKPIRVEIDYDKFWQLAKGQPVHMNVSVLKTLREAGIPVDGPIELRGVVKGKLTMWNERINGKRFCVYEWTTLFSEEEEEEDEDEL